MNKITPSPATIKTDLAHLLPVSIRPIGGQEVNAIGARVLYGQLGLAPSQWSRWYPKNIEKNEFAEEHKDWEGFDIMSNGNPSKDFLLSVPFAKKVAMAAHTAEGELVKDYMLACEQVATNPTIGTPSPAAIAQAVIAALGPKPTWEQPLAEKIEQSRRCAKGTYETIKDKVLPALARLEANPPSATPLGNIKPHDAVQLLNAIARATSNPRAFDAARRAFPALFGKDAFIQPLIPGLEA